MLNYNFYPSIFFCTISNSVFFNWSSVFFGKLLNERTNSSQVDDVATISTREDKKHARPRPLPVFESSKAIDDSPLVLLYYFDTQEDRNGKSDHYQQVREGDKEYTETTHSSLTVDNFILPPFLVLGRARVLHSQAVSWLLLRKIYPYWDKFLLIVVLKMNSWLK